MIEFVQKIYNKKQEKSEIMIVIKGEVSLIFDKKTSKTCVL